MSTIKSNRIKLIYISAFLLFNILSCTLLTTDIFMKNLSPYPLNFFMLINSFFGDLGFFLLFISISILIFKTDYNRCKFLMIISIFFGVIYVGLTIYFQYYGMFFSFYNLAMFSSGGGGDAFAFLLDSLLSLIARAEFIFLLSSFVMVSLFFVLFTKNRKDESFKKSSIVVGYNRILIGLGIFIIGVLIMINGLSAYRYQIDSTWHEDNTTPLYGTQTIGLFNYYIYDAYLYYFTERDAHNEIKYQEIKAKLDSYRLARQKSIIDNAFYDNSGYRGIYEGKNLLLIQVESLNDFVIGLKIDVDGTLVEVTPNLNKMLGSSVYFNNFYNNVGIGNTSDAEFTIMTGLYPIGSSYTVYEYANVQYEALPMAFNNANYYTFSSHANTGIFYERANLHEKLYQFDKHYAKEDLIIKEEFIVHSWLNDLEFLKQNIDIMKANSTNGPVFNFAITITNHMPYKQPAGTEKGEDWFDGKANLLPSDFKLVDGNFKNSQLIGSLEHVSYTDYAIGEAMRYLEESGLADDTIVIIYGDHGCGIEAYEMFYQSPHLLSNDINEMLKYHDDIVERKLLERQLIAKVPLIIYDPTYDANGVNKIEPQTISLVRGFNSISRTIANLFNLEQTYYFGVDALSDAKTFTYNPRNQDIYADGVIISGQSLKYIVTDEEKYNFYTKEKIDTIVDGFLDYKDFNDKLLKYKIFPPLESAPI